MVIVNTAFFIVLGILGKVKKFNATVVNDKAQWCLAALFSLSLVLGGYLDAGISLSALLTKGAHIEQLLFLALIVVFCPLMKGMFALLFYGAETFAAREALREQEVLSVKKSVALFFFAFFVIFACWFVVWMAFYPGLWVYDPIQVEQVINSEYDKHHPLLHTLLLGACYLAGRSGENYDAGMMLYSMIQMAIMGGIFSYSYLYIYRHIKSKAFRVGVLLFFALFPVNPILAISTTKDGIFSALILLCAILTLEFFEGTSQKQRRIKAAVLMVAIVLMLLFRKNGIYAMYLTVAVILFMVLKQKLNRKILAYAVCAVILFTGCDWGLTRALNAKESSIKEALSVPSVQFGRIYDTIAESGVDANSLNIIASHYDMKAAWYDPHISDPMKGRLFWKGDTFPMGAYLKDSLTLFLRYPTISADSFLYLTEGWWYINDVSQAELYNPKPEDKMGYLHLGSIPGYGIESESKLPALEAAYLKLFAENKYQSLPVLSLLFPAASYVWMLLLCTIAMWGAKRKEYALVVGFLIGIVATLIVGPCVLPRYIYPVMICAPLLLCMTINAIKAAKSDSSAEPLHGNM